MRARFTRLLILLLGLASRAAAAPPAFRSTPENAAEERYLNEDIDPFDLLETRSRRRDVPASSAPRVWLSLIAFRNQGSSVDSFGGMAVLGIAFDKIAAPIPRFSQPPPPGEAPPSPSLRPAPSFPLTSRIARKAILAAWRVAGLGVDDARLDAIVARARLSALLPETRLRATHLRNDRTSTQSVPEESQFYDSAAANLGLEARLTWRLDRILYADDEPSFERIRLDRGEARMRLAAKVLEALFVWQRACLDRAASAPGTRDEQETALRVLEAELALDAMTEGWFSEAVLPYLRARPNPKESLPRETR